MILHSCNVLLKELNSILESDHRFPKHIKQHAANSMLTRGKLKILPHFPFVLEWPLAALQKGKGRQIKDQYVLYACQR
ncbi:hypothetical protein T06_14321 [Trichinella sp. T6]|nr:hypothetical protein T06_14321 [Trichinella sp. T6]